MVSMMDPLIPGLPDDVARECLLRVHYTAFSTVGSVCKIWSDQISSPAFHLSRSTSGLTRSIIAMTQSEPNPTAKPESTRSDTKHKPSASPSYRISLYEPVHNLWSTLPAVPGGLPLFCQIAAAGRNVVVVGGWDPASWAASDGVLVYDFVAGAWRRGASMPGPRRSFFACASDSDRTVFVAGGHDEEKNALRSALAYDVVGDRWVAMADMVEERDECKGVFCNGRFRVVGGYSTEFQGQFGKSSESFDVGTWRWGRIEEDTLDVGTCPRTCVEDGGRLYRCRGGKLEVEREGSWSTVAEVPEEVRVAPWVVAVEGGLMVVGSPSCHGGDHTGYVFEVGSGRWRKVDVPEDYSGHVQEGCCLCI